MKNFSKTTLLLALLVFSTIPAVAQNIQAEAQLGMQMAQSYYQTSQMCYSMAQGAGDQQGMQLCQTAMAMHERTYNALSEIVQNPGRVTNAQAFRAELQEYYYRAKFQDFRPSQSIQRELAQFKAHAAWQAGTSEGQRSFQAARNTQQQNFQAGQNAYHQRGQAFDAQNQAWRNGQAASDRNQRSYVNNVWDRSEYVNSNTGQVYNSPNAYDGQTHYDPNTGAELTPYQQYRNW